MERIAVVGAGVAGLSFSRSLAGRGLKPVVLEKSRGVGGRAATRRIDEQPVDHGLVFLHGSHPDFLRAIDQVEGSRIEGWPRKVRGEGRPCQPKAFHPSERRLAFEEGVNVFPKSLARGLDVRKSTRVVEIAPRGGGLEARLQDESSVVAKDLVIALALDQTRRLVTPLSRESEALRSIAAILDMLATDPCLVLIAGYPLDTEVPDWDLCYPSSGSALLLVSHDSTKRPEKNRHVFVFQTRSCFARRYLEAGTSQWAPLVLEEAASILGEWASRPAWLDPHRWRYSRVDSASTLARPFWTRLPNGARIGIAGEAFHPAGGVEGAFLSGQMLAEDYLGEENG